MRASARWRFESGCGGGEFGCRNSAAFRVCRLPVRTRELRNVAL